jgi:hypothetical protein
MARPVHIPRLGRHVDLIAYLEVHGSSMFICLCMLYFLGVLDTLTGHFPGTVYPFGEIDYLVPGELFSDVYWFVRNGL